MLACWTAPLRHAPDSAACRFGLLVSPGIQQYHVHRPRLPASECTFLSASTPLCEPDRRMRQTQLPADQQLAPHHCFGRISINLTCLVRLPVPGPVLCFFFLLFSPPPHNAPPRPARVKRTGLWMELPSLGVMSSKGVAPQLRQKDFFPF